MPGERMQVTTCPSCGLTIAREARFCGQCGARIDPHSGKTDGAEPPKGKTVASNAPARRSAPEASLRTLAAGARLVDEPTAAAASAAPPTAPPVSPLPAGGPPPPRAPSPMTAPTTVTPPHKAATRTLDALIGCTLNNRYLVERKIGEGGFGAVFQGKQLATGRPVALKILHPHNVADATVVARFRREAEASSKLTNPHTVTIYDFDETGDGTLYIAMELVSGRSLQQLQKSEGPLTPRRVLRILDQVADALGEAHDKGVVHRDMKPENVMVDPRRDGDHVKVLDFGIAKIVSEADGMKKPALTAVGQTLGTLEFMSPEQLRGKPLDGRSDIYALGIMAYEMLTGELPFKGAESSTEIIQFHLQEEPPPPSKMRPEARIPGAVDEIVLKMVAKARDERFANAAELRAQIRDVLARFPKRGAARRDNVRVGVAVGGIVALLAVIALLATQ